MILRRDVYRANTKLTPYWLKIPIYGIRGGINVPIKTCHKCENTGSRIGGLFKCPKCGYICHANYNGTMNILKRAVGLVSIAGVL